MIYLFVGEGFFRKKMLHSWKEAFSQKFSDLNIFHIQNIKDFEVSFFAQNLLSTGFFSEKNFVIIDDFPPLSGDDVSELKEYSDFFERYLSQVSSDHIVVFNSQKVDKRSKIYKLLVSIGEIKDFEIKDENTLQEKLLSVYDGKLGNGVIKKAIEKKGVNFENIKNEFDKILITKSKVELSDLADTQKDLEENIFQIVDDILGNNRVEAIQKIRLLGETSESHYAVYNGLLANLRVFYFIFSLQKAGISSQKIKEMLDLQKRSFLVDKQVKIKKDTFRLLYFKLAELDAKMKQGKLIGNTQVDFYYELEKCFITV